MDYLRKYLWLLSSAVGVIGFLLIWVFLPHQSAIDEIWWLMVKFIIFGFIVVGIAFFPNEFKNKHLIVIVPYFFFLGYIIPRMSYFGIYGTFGDSVEMGKCYTTLYLLLYPMIVLTTSFAFRLGGGTPGKVIKICLTGMIIIFSGFLDLMWHTVNSMEIPETFDYAYHIIIFFGRAPRYSEALIFALCHIPLIFVVLLVPLDRWFKKIRLID